MICPKCQNTIRDKAVFCYHCGTQLNVDGISQSAAQNTQSGSDAEPQFPSDGPSQSASEHQISAPASAPASAPRYPYPPPLQYPPFDPNNTHSNRQPGFGAEPVFPNTNLQQPPNLGTQFDVQNSQPLQPPRQFPKEPPQTGQMQPPQYPGRNIQPTPQNPDPNMQFPPQYPDPSIQPPPQYPDPNLQTPQNQYTTPANLQAQSPPLPPKKKMSPLVIILPIAVLLIGAAVAFGIYSGWFGGDNDNNQSDDHNGGQIQTDPTGPAESPNQSPPPTGGNNGNSAGNDQDSIQNVLLDINNVTGGSGQVFTGEDAIPRSIEANTVPFYTLMQEADASGNAYTGHIGAPIPAWAERELGMADYLGLMPGSVMHYLEEPVNRGDYAALAYQFLLRITGMTDSQLQSVVEMEYFPDSYDPAISVCAGLGLLTGDRNGNFRPHEPVTRQTAATILARLADIAGTQGSLNVGSFNDISGLWGEEYIRKVTGLYDPFTGSYVMGSSGGDSRFSPNSELTRISAIITILRLAGATADTYAAQLLSRNIPIQDGLQPTQQIEAKHVADNIFDTYMNMSWSFQSGSVLSSNAVIGNSPNNNYAFWFSVSLVNVGDVIFTSGLVPVGTELSYVRLDAMLPAGEYVAVVSINIINDDGWPVGVVSVPINLIVLS